jgi:hypothetical protein
VVDDCHDTADSFGILLDCGQGLAGWGGCYSKSHWRAVMPERPAREVFDIRQWSIS